MNLHQQTIASSVSCSGIGLHSGLMCEITFHPAQENSGITFVRSDLAEEPSIPADVSFVTGSIRGTTLTRGKASVRTVEHVLAAFAGLQIDNAIIELTAEEPPAMDGSAKSYVELICKAGISTQSKERDMLVIDREVVLKDSVSGARIEARPSDEFCISGTIEYNGILGRQSIMLRNMENFRDEIAPARTYGFLSELKALKEAGLVKGGNLNNAVIFIDNPLNNKLRNELLEMFEIDPDEIAGNNGILNQGGLRFPDEPVRHKVLDLIGDLTLLGQPIKGEIIAQRMGHSVNIDFVKILKKKFMQNEEVLA